MATKSKKVFIDPSVFLAFIDRADPKHSQAIAYFRYFAQEQYQLYTDCINIINAAREIHINISPSLSRDFLRIIFLSNINILYPQEPEIKSALKILLSYHSMDLTFRKAIIGTLANKRNIPQICSFEYVYPLYGITLFYLPI